jgi:hypothetical protein
VKIFFVESAAGGYDLAIGLSSDGKKMEAARWYFMAFDKLSNNRNADQEAPRRESDVLGWDAPNDVGRT